ncbi:MAG: hypothetical protein HRT88_17655, partial [Lentisphaeraceae bacterium]|nr:hypothetical protein [Lentisphaeraceae bacterium]
MSSRLWQILAAYKELPSTSLFYKTTQQYARDQYVRVVHESNALESTGPESEAQTKTLGDDLAVFLLDYH